MGTMRQVVLRAHPRGNPRAEDFAVEQAPVPTPGPNEVLIETAWLSLDPLIRFALDETPITGIARVRLGEVIYGGTVGTVVASNHPDYTPGDVVEGRTGWRDYAAVDPARVPLRRIDPALAPIETALGLLGMPGQTAHACVIEIGRVAAGETLVISAAGGAVGTIAGQIGKLLSARVVGIAGGPDKCRAVEAIGFDACVDYKAPDFAAQLAKACPDRINVYVDNVAGPVTQTVMPLLAMKARMPVCGFISYYGVGMEGPGPDRLPGFLRLVMSRMLEVRGFGGAMTAGPQAITELAGWLAQGRIRNVQTVVEGLEAAPAAFAQTFQGGNPHIGKLVVRVGG
ncbi:MAG: NADP-dependent oxidoreductase [Sphingomonas sp.]